MPYETSVRVAHIVRDAGGRIVGRTRLQKVAYLLSAAGLEEGFQFVYKHYGPFSDELAKSAREADLLGLLRETEDQATWGGTYSTYSFIGGQDAGASAARRQLASQAAAADAIELELAATAVFLYSQGSSDPWEETARRKPEKAIPGRMERAQSLYRKLAEVETPVPLPRI